LGELKFFLSLEVARSKQGILINQHKYASKILFVASLLACKLASTPINNAKKLSSSSRDLYYDMSAYKHLIVRLIYLTNTGPNISFSAHNLEQFLSKPTHDTIVVH
ncbi:hypothetical protein V8G54_007772, partial [Vigna mungo]